MLRQPIAWRWQVSLGLASVLALVSVYTYLAARQHGINPDDRTLPTWHQLLTDGLLKVFKSKHSGTEQAWIWADTKATFNRLVAGLVLGVLFSVIVGLLMGCYSPIEAFFLPPLSFLAKIPPTAMLAVFFVMAGTGTGMFVTMIAFGVLPTLAQTIYHAAKEDVPEELLFKAYTLGASQVECIWDVVYKHTLPKILEGVRLQVGPAMVYLIAAEMLVGDVGFGYRIKMQGRLLDMSVVYIYLACLGLAGYLIDRAFILVQRKLCPWYAQ
ncbi:MAG: ABC transporter permease subunit [Planctomycetes bacterium]|nr:ABC transporter permease subunit [Planctomycetota bacterium]